ncbi:PEP-CTERM-box response regulator transcription factor [Roseomonas aerophila]|uniref:PEP-CTERM-box response regulator transcription factor n=1 Tax=Teichococcus aerophilus TaxID=1224513 RepID=A0ABR7RNZ7_9PROT|nr:PEP-CTERM-box response regulator transcription factor [Pseudoroseomonas aerophila]MBC9208289.1 PEP-CTERM-box response regulator transcription factor [Pseudoroseomonas aerophila]
MSRPKLLVVEDDAALAAQYRWAFPNCRVLLAADRRQAEQIARAEQPTAALLDLGLPPDEEGVSEGFATLATLSRLCPGMPIIIASGQGQREHTLRAIGLGAYDFCEKPVDLDVLRTIVDRALRLRALEEENLRLAALPRPSPIRDIVTADESMLRICHTIERLSQVSVPVLLLGESGTGKEALARALHDMGPRSRKPFVAINCAAIPEPLLESELFGHERGAFTGAVKQVTGRIEAANGGTLFLDEVGDLPPALQAKLLRFLQDQVIERVGGRTSIRVDVRIVSATNQPLEEQTESGRFRADLLYRLNSLTIRIPPLRERGEDSLLLARWFLARYAKEFGRRLRGLDASAVEAVTTYRWPGNVRELGNRVRRAALMTEGHTISASDLELSASPSASDTDLDLRAARLRAERATIERALARSNGSLAAAARLLGVSRPTIYGLLETHRLSPSQTTPPDTAARDTAPSDGDTP